MFFTLPIHAVYTKQTQSSVLSPTYPVSSLEPCPLLLCFLSSARVDIMVRVPCKPDHPATQPAGLSVLALQNHVPCSLHLAIFIMPQFPVSVALCSRLHLLPHTCTFIMSYPQTSFRSGKLFGQGGVPSVFDCLLLGGPQPTLSRLPSPAWSLGSLFSAFSSPGRSWFHLVSFDFCD